MSKRPLSNIEHLAEVNISCSVGLLGRLDLGELRTALNRVQRRHPALRALIRPENDVLYYDPDAAPEIPLRIVPAANHRIYRREWEFELSTPFSDEQPQLRIVYFELGCDCELLFTTSHRICDGLSVFIIAKDVLQALTNRTELNIEEPVSVADIIGEYQPARPWLTSVGVSVINLCLRLLPSSGPVFTRKEHFAEWSAGRDASASLRLQCKAEGVSIHAAFLVALHRALHSVLGARAPKWITCPIDLRRGRFPVLKEDTVFYGGGNFKIRTGRSLKGDFWENARVLNREIRALVDREIGQIPPRLYFFEKMRPLRCGQVRWLLRVSEALRSKRRVKGIGLANLGAIYFNDADSPLPIKDVRFSARSLNFGVLGLIPYTVNGDMRFYCMNSDPSVGEGELQALKREFMQTLSYKTEEEWMQTATA